MFGSRRRRLVWVALALVPSLASCSPTTDGRPSAVAVSTTTSKSDLPAKAWNQQIFLCTSLSSAPCRGETTAAEVSTVRAQLAADPAVTHVEFLSELDIIKVARIVLPASERNSLEVGYLPAEFLVSTAAGAALAPQYGKDAGVSSVVGCPVANRCAVSTLRAAGLVH